MIVDSVGLEWCRRTNGLQNSNPYQSVVLVLKARFVLLSNLRLMRMKDLKGCAKLMSGADSKMSSLHMTSFQVKGIPTSNKEIGMAYRCSVS
jgi:hypothetical protein